MSTKSPTSEASETIRNFYAAVDRKPHDRSTLETFFAMNFKDNNRPPAPAEIADRDVILGLFDQLNSGLPTAKHDLIIVEPISDNRAIVYWKFYGTHSGAFFDQPASGNNVAINGFDIFRVKDGQFTEHWHVEELASMFAQMGAK